MNLVLLPVRRCVLAGVLFLGSIGPSSAHDVWLTLSGPSAERRVIINYGHPDDRGQGGRYHRDHGGRTPFAAQWPRSRNRKRLHRGQDQTLRRWRAHSARGALRQWLLDQE